MHTIHCHLCGGFIGNPTGTIYRTPDPATSPAVPHSALCVCAHPVAELRAHSGAYLIRSASRN